MASPPASATAVVLPRGHRLQWPVAGHRFAVVIWRPSPDEAADVGQSVGGSHPPLAEGTGHRATGGLVADDASGAGGSTSVPAGGSKRGGGVGSGRRRTGGTSRPSRRQRPRPSERADLDRDLDVLASSATTTRRTRASVPTPRQLQRQKHLALLQRRRAGENVDPMGSTDEEDEADDDGEEGGASGRRHPQRRAVARPARARYTFNRDLDLDSDFVVPDDEDDQMLRVPTGRPGGDDDDDEDDDDEDDDRSSGDVDDEAEDEDDDLQTMPLQFTHMAHRRPQDHLTDVIAWMVHHKLKAVLPSSAATYRTAFMRLDVQAHGLAHSRFISSAWRAEFVLALQARPVFLSMVHEGVPGAGPTGNCEACGRSRHAATFRLQFAGQPYHEETLEPLSSSEPSASDGEDHASRHDRDVTGRSIPDESTTWATGKYCRQNAEKAHLLLHWKYQLQHYVTGLLLEDGYLARDGPDPLADWTVQERNFHADGILKRLVRDGEINVLYAEYQSILDGALLQTGATAGAVSGAGPRRRRNR
ncbi:MAG: hypothetical protein M1826_004740 [Phylliscum demangeonii]|nr:MAG: hypothetical protein M1826_004740 [Phylliscum demangeonii]